MQEDKGLKWSTCLTILLILNYPRLSKELIAPASFLKDLSSPLSSQVPNLPLLQNQASSFSCFRPSSLHSPLFMLKTLCPENTLHPHGMFPYFIQCSALMSYQNGITQSSCEKQHDFHLLHLPDCLLHSTFYYISHLFVFCLPPCIFAPEYKVHEIRNFCCCCCLLLYL